MENKIFITDETGKEYEMNILLTFENEGKNFVVVYENGKEDELYSFYYDENSNLTEVTDEKDLDLVNEVISAFDDEVENA